jgi:hypothetical protein
MYLEARKSTVTPTSSGDTFSVAGNESTGAVYIEQKNSMVMSSVSVTRPNDGTAYTAGDVVGAATGSTAALTFTSIGAINKVIRITGTRFEVDVTAVPSGMTSFRLHLYNVTPPSALGDNAAWDLPAGDRASYLGYVDLGSPVDAGSTLYVQQTGLDYDFLVDGTTSLYGYLVTNGAYTPTAQAVKKVTLYALAM